MHDLTPLHRPLEIPEIDADTAKASTLPGRLYGDDRIYDLAREWVFARSWQFVDQAECLKVPGATNPTVPLEGCLDEAIVFTRDWDDEVRCLSNVCTHRGALVCEHSGVEREDEEVVESAQACVRARLCDRGRHSAKRETGVHHFHHLCCEALRS